MGRFSNLEQNASPSRAPADSSLSAPMARARNEEDYLREADESLRGGRPESALRSFSRALEFNPNLVQAWDARRGAEDLRDRFTEHSFTEADRPQFVRLRRLQALRDAGRLDPNLRWVGAVSAS